MIISQKNYGDAGREGDFLWAWKVDRVDISWYYYTGVMQGDGTQPCPGIICVFIKAKGMVKMTEVAAAFIRGGSRFMICQRPSDKKRGLLWEFAGGKVEAGETAADALVRECREELGIGVRPIGVFAEVTHEYPDITVHITLFDTQIVDGEPQRLEHNDIRWILPEDIPKYDFCPADTEILEKIMAEHDKNMAEVYEFLKRCGTYYLATVDECGRPHVRPFGTIDIFDNALYIQTGRKKAVSEQMRGNPEIEICAVNGGEWLRVSASVSPDERLEPQRHLLDAYPELQAMYQPGDGNNEVFRLGDVKAVFCSFGAPERTVRF